ncbi:hypothetical protein Tco_1315828 [Tanacetum coccineum]
MPPRRTSVANAAARAVVATTAAAPMTVAAVEKLIEARVSAALANHETLRNSTNGHGDGGHNSETEIRGTVRTPHEAKRRNSRAKTKTFKENSYPLPYAVSSKEDTAYQHQHITRTCIRLIPNPAYHSSPIRRIQLVISQRSAVNVIDGN